MTVTINKIMVDQAGAAELLSTSKRTIASIDESLLPKCRFGKSVRYRVADLESLAERIACGEVAIGRTNK